MAHSGQKLGFGAARHLCSLLGLLQCDLGPLALGDFLLQLNIGRLQTGSALRHTLLQASDEAPQLRGHAIEDLR